MSKKKSKGNGEPVVSVDKVGHYKVMVSAATDTVDQEALMNKMDESGYSYIDSTYIPGKNEVVMRFSK